jgi:hypothetical protein
MRLPGVNIVEKGTNNGAMIDFDGNYTIKVPSVAIDKNPKLTSNNTGY